MRNDAGRTFTFRSDKENGLVRVHCGGGPVGLIDLGGPPIEDEPVLRMCSNLSLVVAELEELAQAMRRWTGWLQEQKRAAVKQGHVRNIGGA